MHTHLIQRKTGRVYVRTNALDARNDMTPAVFDQKSGKFVSYGEPEPVQVLVGEPEPKMDADEAAIRIELEKLTKAEIDQLAKDKFGADLNEHGTKAAMIDAVIKLTADAKKEA
ncbi:MAG: hypothetical protein RBT11_14170 [Desulfobacterales bacterium]|nr:hypothetical protein [Desulfobacterales bacterium]